MGSVALLSQGMEGTCQVKMSGMECFEVLRHQVSDIIPQTPDLQMEAIQVRVRASTPRNHTFIQAS